MDFAIAKPEETQSISNHANTNIYIHIYLKKTDELPRSQKQIKLQQLKCHSFAWLDNPMAPSAG